MGVDGDNGRSEYDAQQTRLGTSDSINTSFNAQDLLNSMSVYADDTLTNEIYGAISGILMLKSHYQMTLDEAIIFEIDLNLFTTFIFNDE